MIHLQPLARRALVALLAAALLTACSSSGKSPSAPDTAMDAREAAEKSGALRKEAAALLAAGRKDQALGRLQSAVKINPADKEAWLELSRVATELKKWTDAVKAGEMALSLDGQDPQAHLALGLALHGSGRPADALGHLETAYKAVPEQQSVTGLALARATEAAGRPVDAVELLRTLVDRYPADKDLPRELTRLGGGPAVEWPVKAPQDRFLGDRLVQFSTAGLTAVAADRSTLWVVPLKPPVRLVAYHPDRPEALVLTDTESTLVDLAGGKKQALPPLPKPKDVSDNLVRVQWRGDRVLYSWEVWAGGQYRQTQYLLYQIDRKAGHWEEVASFTGGQVAQMATDGRTVLLTGVPGIARLFVEGKLKKEWNDHGHYLLTSKGDFVLLSAGMGTLALYKPDGEPAWVKKQGGGGNPGQWDGPGGELRLIVQTSGKYQVYNSKGDVLWSGEGKPRPFQPNPRYLLVEGGPGIYLADTTGRRVVTYPIGYAPDWAPDGKSIAITRDGGLTVYPAPASTGK